MILRIAIMVVCADLGVSIVLAIIGAIITFKEEKGWKDS